MDHHDYIKSVAAFATEKGIEMPQEDIEAMAKWMEEYDKKPKTDRAAPKRESTGDKRLDLPEDVQRELDGLKFSIRMSHLDVPYMRPLVLSNKKCSIDYMIRLLSKLDGILDNES